tara:strand:- start:2371 stop:2661 length:291 start_codon:yes stop_codon:yes gene_type:complete
MTIDELIQNFYVQKELIEKEIEQYDKDFSNKKLNPYGVTTIEFEKRSDAFRRRSELTGAIDALLICKEQVLGDNSPVGVPTYDEPEEMEVIGATSD